MKNRALFLDRDGVINLNHGYVHKRENFDFIDGVFDLARQANEQNYKVVVVTNQAGIGRGLYTEEDFNQLTDWMCKQFVDSGACIDRVYFSPFHPTAGIGKYMRDDFSRKPQPGMLLRAGDDMNIDLGASIMIGDKASDIKAGIAAGVGLNLLLSEQHAEELRGVVYECIHTLYEALPYLAERNTLRGVR